MGTNNNSENLQPECLQMSVNLINAGEFITDIAARRSLNSYFKEPGVPDPEDKSHIYGHTFGLNKFREMLEKIDKHNSEIKDDDLRIHGVRVYYGKSKRNDPDFVLDPPDGEFRDVFFMPVLKSGKDLYTIHKLRDGGIILGSSRPCPNQCGFQFY
jgi:hypothetical protein